MKRGTLHMIKQEDILSLQFIKKTEYTGSCQKMRYRLEKYISEDITKLKATVWPEPFNFFKTPSELKHSSLFDFSEEGIADAVCWMNERLEEKFL